MNPGCLLFLLFGCTVLQLICCYSDGTLLETECQGMNINHGMSQQNGVAPFAVKPEQKHFTDANVGETISVELKANPSSFNGFMLEAFKCDDSNSNCKLAGTFSLTDSSRTVLLTCDGQPGRAVSHSDNNDKYSITVNWRVPEAGTFYFRAAFTQSYSIFWLSKSIAAPTTTTQRTPTTSTTAFTTPYTTGTDAATTTAEINATNHAGSTTITTAGTTAITTAETNATNHTGLPTITTAATTAITTAETNATKHTGSPTITTAGTTAITTAETNATNHTGSPTITTAVIPPSPVPVDFVYTFQRCVLALLLFSRLCFLGGSSVMLITPFLKAVRNVAKILFVLELASKITAFILVVIRAKKYPSVGWCAFFGVEFTALTGIAMVLSLLHTITIFLYCGPSHELRKCWLYAVIVFHLLNTSITTAAIFVGVWCFQGHWLPILMGVYVIWEILLYLISHGCDQVEKQRRNTGAERRRRISRMIILGFFSVLNIMFTIALITGVFVTLMVMGRFPGQGLD